MRSKLLRGTAIIQRPEQAYPREDAKDREACRECLLQHVGCRVADAAKDIQAKRRMEVVQDSRNVR